MELKNKALLSGLVFKRLYTSGCGKGVFFYNALDIMHRKVERSDFEIPAGKIIIVGGIVSLLYSFYVKERLILIRESLICLPSGLRYCLTRSLRVDTMYLDQSLPVKVILD